MMNNNDDYDNFLSDKKVEEVQDNQYYERKRRGAFQQNEENTNKEKAEKEYEDYQENDSNILNVIVIILAIVVVIISVFVIIKVLKKDKPQNDNKVENEVVSTTNDNNQEKNKQEQNTDSSELSIANVNENYDIYPIKIESVVHIKRGNFYNNNDAIKGDKVYVEYKQISGLKDSKKQEQINEKLKNLSIELYDKDYLADKDTLYVDIHSKLSVNFNTLSYIVYKTGQDIDGNEIKDEIKTLNIRLDNLDNIKFEDLFVDSANIGNIYSNYTKGKVEKYYFDPKKIYVYDTNLKEKIIDMSQYYSDIAIYKRFKTSDSLFNSNPTSKKVFTILDSNVSEETKDRAFEKNK